VSQPTWDIVSGRATVVIIDTDGELKDLAVKDQLKDIREVVVIFGEAKIGTFANIEVQYNLKSGECRLTCRDSLHSWETIHYSGVLHRPQNTGYSFFDMLRRATRSLTFEDVRIGEGDEDCEVIESYLQRIKLPHGFLRPQSLRSAWRQLCEIALGYIYKDVDGIIKFALH